MEEAVDCALHDVARDPMSPRPAMLLPFYYRCASRPEDAIEACWKALEKFPEDPEVVADVWAEMALAYTMMGLPDSAFAIAERDNIDFEFDTEWNWPQVYAAAGMRDSVMVWVEKALKLWEE